jgi:parallel beta-helix repeat protein
MTATNRTVVANNIVTGNVRGSGIHLSQGCDEVSLLGNIVGENDEGIEIEDAVNSTIRANRVYSSRYYGLNLTTAGNLTVVDNYFNNRVNVRTPTGPFTGLWSLEALAATNVVGNSFIGGNYWGSPDGTGYSDTTPDWDGDGFVNGIYVLPGQIGVDHLPLSPSPALLTYTTVPASAASIGPLSTDALVVTAAPDPWAGWRKTYPIGDGLNL